jgi:hypothetical protein
VHTWKGRRSLEVKKNEVELTSKGGVLRFLRSCTVAMLTLGGLETQAQGIPQNLDEGVGRVSLGKHQIILLRLKIERTKDRSHGGAESLTSAGDESLLCQPCLDSVGRQCVNATANDPAAAEHKSPAAKRGRHVAAGSCWRLP